MAAKSPRNSHNIGTKMQELMKYVRKKDEQLVFAYMRIESNRTDVHLPNAIIRYILVYGCLIEEYFGMPSAGTQLSNNGTSITMKSYLYETSFGEFVVDCNLDTKYVYSWLIQINEASLEVAIGLVDDTQRGIAKERKLFYREERVTNYGWRNCGYLHECSHRGIQMDSAEYDSGDLLKLVFDTKTQTIFLYNGETLVYTMDNIKPGMYRFAVFLWSHREYGYAAVTIKKFWIE